MADNKKPGAAPANKPAGSAAPPAKPAAAPPAPEQTTAPAAADEEEEEEEDENEEPSYTVSEDGNYYVIRIIKEPKGTKSKSGDSYLLATTRGNQPTDMRYKGRPVKVSVNLYAPVR